MRSADYYYSGYYINWKWICVFAVEFVEFLHPQFERDHLAGPDGDDYSETNRFQLCLKIIGKYIRKYKISR